MHGKLYDRALDGERCWVRRDDGVVQRLPVRKWLGGRHADGRFDHAVVQLCSGPTIDLGCGPGRLVTELVRRGVPALGVDQSATAVGMAQRSGAPVLHRDVFEPLPGTGRWQTVLLADGNVGPPNCSAGAASASASSTPRQRVSAQAGSASNRLEASVRGSGGRWWESIRRRHSPPTRGWC
jgi:SAM-dependent methyltransferase